MTQRISMKGLTPDGDISGSAPALPGYPCSGNPVNAYVTAEQSVQRLIQPLNHSMELHVFFH